ncbi:uncharacterized protein EKO05_0004883 [Ascochyta rabiei]|uniref:uncharacterized protein n=1 Tax=Didymella rabiei TaxID=5454 RepID=UPI0022067DE2|nr:uncharacterized protein EKO05_0004883 [Ascochyta rabiei]UPX14400.1 hypothetical protein EKO05_0004883 [Ascochyta rabiei]
MFTILVAYEEDWEAKNPLRAAAARTTNCASTAIKLAQAESVYPARLSPTFVKSVKTEPVRERRKVGFTPQAQVQDREDTFLIRTMFVHSRPQGCYYRSSSAYQRGMCTCSPGSEYIDTSEANLLPANVSNLKIYLTDDENAFDSLQSNPSLYGASVGDCQGIVSLHRLTDDIFRSIHDYSVRDDKTKDDLEVLTEGADGMVVLVDEHGNLLDGFLFDGSVEGEEDSGNESSSEKRKRADQGCWTCLKEYLL